MTGDVVYNTLLSYLRLDKRGSVLSPDEFNAISSLVNRRVLAFYCKRYEEDIDSSSELGKLKVVGRTTALTSGVGVLPTTYYRLTGDPYYTDTSVTPNETRYIDIVTSKESSYRERDYLTKSTLRNPTCIIGTQDAYGILQIRVKPTTITTIKVDYLRIPSTPFLDYYVNDTTLAYTFLDKATSYTVATGYTYRDGTTGVKSSITVDWEWDEDSLPLIIAYFISAMGGIIPDELMLSLGIKDITEIQGV